MRLNLTQIKNITLGAARVEENENGIDFYRFTKTQEELYKNRSADFYMKSFASSGVKLSFCTDSEIMSLKIAVTKGSSRSYFSVDVFVNGKKLDSLSNFNEENLPLDYTKIGFDLGGFSKEFELGSGEKQVEVYLPWSVKTTLKELVLEDGAFIKPIKPDYKLLAFGDSITHGYDALHPSNKYISQFARFLNAEEYNKAIGGEIFFPELAAAKEDFIPDYITVAYGTNDWSKCSFEEFSENCKGFLQNLSENYPKSKIYVITPIWRKEVLEEAKLATFKEVTEFIKNTAELYSNMTVIGGFDFVPKREEYFADLRLHPNEKGFDCYFKNLTDSIKI